VKLEGAEECFVELGVCEDGQDVFEEDTGRWEIGELTERRLELCLELRELVQRTGLFGGATRGVSRRVSALKADDAVPAPEESSGGAA
jgi:hypothetical protein